MNVCIIGLGVVGRGVYDILTKDNLGVNVSYVLELDKEKTKDIDCVTDSFETVLNDDNLDCVIELIGGKTIAYKFVKEALKAKKHVVTANKALISAYFEELTKLAKQNNVQLRYEASVGGAINIIDPLMTISRLNKICKIQGIINGSTNFILSKIFIEDYNLDKALEEALSLGYIETGSTDDLDGLDLMRKINILSMISYNQYIKEEEIITVPLSSLTKEFYEYVKQAGLVIKYLATSKLLNNQIQINLEPVIISKNDFLNTINYEENIVSIYGEYHKKQSFIGQGAGRYPTASAIVYDILKIKAKDINNHNYEGSLPVNKDLEKQDFLANVNGEFKIINTVTSLELLKNKDIICFARIEKDAYEKI